MVEGKYARDGEMGRAAAALPAMSSAGLVRLIEDRVLIGAVHSRRQEYHRAVGFKRCPVDGTANRRSCVCVCRAEFNIQDNFRSHSNCGLSRPIVIGSEKHNAILN